MIIQQRNSAIALFAAWIICAALALLQVMMFYNYTVDDAYITFRYIKQWVAGNGLVFNIGERVEGYSNFLWIVLLAPFYALGADLVVASKMLGILLAGITLILTAALTGEGWRGVGASLLLAAAAPFGVWMVGGLETMLFSCLFAASALAFIHEEEQGRGWWSGVLFALLALTRPEGLMFGLLAALLRGAHLWRGQLRVQPNDWARLGLWLAPVAIHFIWRLSYYGYPLPNTVYAKSMGFHPRAFIEGVHYLYASAAAIGGVAPVLVVGLATLLVRPNLRFVYLFASVVLYAAFIVVSGGDWMPAQRFLTHVLPAVAALSYLGLRWIAQRFERPWQTVALGSLVSAQVAFLLLGSIETRVLPRLTFPPADAEIGMNYLRANLQPGDVVAVTDAGGIGYSLPLDVRILDMFGLTDAHIAHLKPQFPSGLFGRGDGFGKWDVDYVLAQSPRFVQASVLGVDEQGNYLSSNTSNALLLNDPRFRARYRLVKGVPGLEGFFERIQ